VLGFDELLVSVLRGRVRRDVVVRSVGAVRECSRRRGEESVSRVSNGAVVRDFRSVRRRRSLIYFKIFFILLYCSFPLSFFSPITCENNIFVFNIKLSSKIYHPTTRARKRERERTMSGVTTRAQKRRIGERDVWDLIVNNDDICFKHVLPRLNGTDLKFLYGVNTETRKLIKRSSRESDLKKKFKVSEMSSISTLEVAWENKSLWSGYLKDETWFCFEVAKTNKLELLK